MSALAGKNFRTKVSPTAGGAGVYTAVAGINSATMTQNAETVDISQFSSSYIERLQGLKDASYDLAGHFEAGDTNGQNAIRTAFTSDSTLWVQFLPDGSAGFKQEVKVASVEIGAEVNGKVGVTYKLVGTGAIATV